MIEVDPLAFEEMVGTALDGLPPGLGRLMRNVAVVVDNDSRQLGLLGLYRGVPLTERTHQYSAVLPDQITIYRWAICSICSSTAEVVEEVRRTVIHEVGHHFGIDDHELHELGW
jgi:predicted Zn-dependent protease with MMP-like domain